MSTRSFCEDVAIDLAWTNWCDTSKIPAAEPREN